MQSHLFQCKFTNKSQILSIWLQLDISCWWDIFCAVIWTYKLTYTHTPHFNSLGRVVNIIVHIDLLYKIHCLCTPNMSQGILVKTKSRTKAFIKCGDYSNCYRLLQHTLAKHDCSVIWQMKANQLKYIPGVF